MSFVSSHLSAISAKVALADSYPITEAANGVFLSLGYSKDNAYSFTATSAVGASAITITSLPASGVGDETYEAWQITGGEVNSLRWQYDEVQIVVEPSAAPDDEPQAGITQVCPTTAAQ